MTRKTTYRRTFTLAPFICDEIDEMTEAHPTHGSRSRTLTDLLMRLPEFQAAARRNNGTPQPESAP